MIDLMPPGLYEAVITGIDESVENPGLVQGNYLFSLETRKLEDIRKLSGNSPEDDLAFAGRPGFRDHPGGLPHINETGGAEHGDGNQRRGDATHSPEPPSLRDVFGREPVYAAIGSMGGSGAWKPPPSE
jgi:hypothetical protein